MVLFAGNPPSIENEKRRAKLYSEIYQYVSEDFTNYKDINIFIRGLFVHLQILEKRIATLTATLNTHTHKVAPHIHPILPHTHISTLPGLPTSPNILGYTTVVNIPIEGLFSTQQPKIVWPIASMPLPLINTTGAITNLINNIGVSIGGSLESEELGVHKVRAAPLPILAIPSIPNYLKPTSII